MKPTNSIGGVLPLLTSPVTPESFATACREGAASLEAEGRRALTAAVFGVGSAYQNAAVALQKCADFIEEAERPSLRAENPRVSAEIASIGRRLHEGLASLVHHLPSRRASVYSYLAAWSEITGRVGGSGSNGASGGAGMPTNFRDIAMSSTDLGIGNVMFLSRLRSEPIQWSGTDIPDAIRILNLGQREAYTVYAFVKSNDVSDVQDAWGEDTDSFFAHFYHITTSAAEPEVLLTLEREGGVDEFVGLFSTHEAAVSALAARGSFEAL
jgi:hypothetical protein